MKRMSDGSSTVQKIRGCHGTRKPAATNAR
jgi:hypothetical protein